MHNVAAMCCYKAIIRGN